jgi:diketogulonate reductase-like aldo/keto reductase
MSARLPRTVDLGGKPAPVLGLGTWGWAERPERRDDEIAALHTALDLGLTLVDTAEMYGDGAAEALLGAALGQRRDEAFLVSKVLPSNASRQGTIDACRRSLRRLRTGHLDLYLLHWRGPYPLRETVEGFEYLLGTGEIRSWGVSNFDLADMAELMAVPGGQAVATDQVLYNLTRRGIEFDLLPWCRTNEIPVMAYSPLEQGRLLRRPELASVARRHDATPAQVALAWLLGQDGLSVIPRAGNPAHVRDNHAALDLRLTSDDLAELDRAFPAPRRQQPLEML